LLHCPRDSKYQESVCRQQTRVELGHGLEPVAERLQYTGQTGSARGPNPVEHHTILQTV